MANGAFFLVTALQDRPRLPASAGHTSNLTGRQCLILAGGDVHRAAALLYFAAVPAVRAFEFLFDLWS